MKCFVVLVVICAKAWADDTFIDIHQAVKECGAGNGGPNQVKQSLDLQKDGPTLFCVLNKSGMIDENGDMIENNVRDLYQKEYATEKEVDAVIVKCGTKNGKTREEAAFNLFICFKSLPSIAVVAADRHDDIKAAAKDCSLTKELFQEGVDKEKFGAAILCVNKKIGLMNEDGSINENVFKSDAKLWNSDDALSQKIFNNCKDLKGENPKIKAYNLAKCIKETRG
ncbi:unnamed protein product [Diabrotica balteata]|uniref:Uncharacterized protein n=1 Tax=Diabrotica balteata TaxID=107213 RepID=A0A9P0GWH6_DIABA|nr:unnamed protein product [Diabrotica balteata]